MTHKLYTTRVSFEVLIEATDTAAANKSVNDWLDTIKEGEGVLSWEGADWMDPEELPGQEG
jgi:hypothetical protein